TTLTGSVNDVAFSPDGTTVATASDDGTARMWNAHTGQPITTLTGSVNDVAFSPDGTTVATISNDNTARLCIAILPPDKQTKKLCSAKGRSLTKEEWPQYLPDHPYEQISQN